MAKEQFSPRALRNWSKFLYEEAVTADRLSVNPNFGDDYKTGFIEFGTPLGEYSEFFFGTKSGLAEKIAILSEQLARPVDLFVLGAGNGQMARELAEISGEQVLINQLSASDVRYPWQARKDQTLGVNFSAGDMHEVDFGTDCFDLVLARYVLLHSPDPFRILKKLYRSLRPNGQVFAHLPESYYLDLTGGINAQDFTQRINGSGVPAVMNNGVLELTKTNPRLKLPFIKYNHDQPIDPTSLVAMSLIYQENNSSI